MNFYLNFTSLVFDSTVVKFVKAKTVKTVTFLLLSILIFKINRNLVTCIK